MLHEDAGVLTDLRRTRKADLERADLLAGITHRLSKITDTEVPETQRDIAMDGPSRAALKRHRAISDRQR